MQLDELLIAIVLLPSAITVLVWCYFIVSQAKFPNITRRTAAAVGLFVASAKSIAMVIGDGYPPPNWAQALVFAILAAWVLTSGQDPKTYGAHDGRAS